MSGDTSSGRAGAVMGWRMRKIPYKEMFEMVKLTTPQVPMYSIHIYEKPIKPAFEAVKKETSAGCVLSVSLSLSLPAAAEITCQCLLPGLARQKGIAQHCLRNGVGKQQFITTTALCFVDLPEAVRADLTLITRSTGR